MIEIKRFLKGFMSRKWLLSVAVMVCSYQIPMTFKKADISDAVTLMTLGLISGVGVGYGVINIKDKKTNGDA